MENIDPVYGGDTLMNLKLGEENRRLLSKVLQLNAELTAARAERDELMADNARLREALKMARSFREGGTALASAALAATSAQSLARIRNEVLEKAARVCDEYADDPVYCGNAIRAMKEPE